MEQTYIEGIQNIVLQFRIPFSFDVLNSFLKDDVGKPYFVIIDKIPVQLHFQRIYEFKYKSEGFDISAYTKMKEDRHGILSHSNVQIWFDRQTSLVNEINKFCPQFYPEQFLDIGLKYLNKFIKSYKAVTEEYWLRPLINSDIFNLRLFLVYVDGKQGQVEKPIRNEMICSGGEEFKLPDESEKRLRDVLLADYDELALASEFYLNFVDNINLENYNIAILQAITLFEYFVYTSLKQKLSKRKLDKIKKKSCGCMAGISEVCENGIKTYFNNDFGSTLLYKDLKENALKYRNLIVHGELINNVDKETCEKAIKSVSLAQQYLMENVFKNRVD